MSSRTTGRQSRRSFLIQGAAVATSVAVAGSATGAAKRVRLRSSNLPAGASGTIWIGGDLQVNRIGLGTAGYIPLKGEPADYSATRAVLRRAYDLGVNLIDTANGYGDAERYVCDALYPYPSDLVIATKGGNAQDATDSGGSPGRPEHLRAACEGSLKRLKLEQIALYYLHQPDRNVPYEDSVGELGKLQKEGKIRHIGVSNVDAGQLAKARSIVNVVAVQNRYNILSRGADDVLEICEREHIVHVPYSPFGGRRDPKVLTSEDARLAAFQALARERHVSLPEIVLAWLLARSPVMLPIPGTLDPGHLETNVGAAKVRLTQREMEQLR